MGSIDIIQWHELRLQHFGENYTNVSSRKKVIMK